MIIPSPTPPLNRCFGCFAFAWCPAMFEPVIAPVVERLREAGVVRLGIFGSFARGESLLDSDVDALVRFRPAARSIDNLLAVGEALEQVLVKAPG